MNVKKFYDKLDKKLIFNKKFKIIDSILISNNLNKNLKNFEIQFLKYGIYQYDEYTKSNYYRNRLLEATQWDKKKIKKETVLEIGSGAGKYTAILKKLFKNVITVEPTDAIYLNKKMNGSKNILYIKSTLENMPLKKGSFNYIFCFGVMQHLQKPELGYKKIIRYLSVSGKASFDHYLKNYYPTPWETPKRFWRPITTRISPEILLKIVKFYIPYYYYFDSFLKSFMLGKMLAAIIPIPCYNYRLLKFHKNILINLAILDTYDALASKYDYAWTINKTKSFFKNFNYNKIEIEKKSNGIVINFEK